MTPQLNKDKHQAGEIIAAFGLKSAIGKTTVIRCLADLCDEIGRAWSGVSVDRSERLPMRYPGKIGQVTLPADSEGRLDPYAMTRAFSPLDDAIDTAIKDRLTLLVDVGSGEYPRAMLEHAGRSRLNSLLARNGVGFTALLVTTVDPMVMTDVPRLAEAVISALPAAKIVVVLNERGGVFRFADGTETQKVWKSAVSPVLQKYPSATLPTMPAGCWDRFEDQGLRFSQVGLLDPETKEADERKLISWTRETRSVAIARQGDVADWLHGAWSALSPIIVAPPPMEAGNE